MTNLQKFCSVNDIRTHLLAPMCIPGVGTVYCNGHIAVVTPGDVELTADLPASLIESLNKMNVKRVEVTAGAGLSIPELPPSNKCSECKGSGRVSGTVECDECDGGDFRHGSHRYECKECDGSGKIKNRHAPTVGCPSCDGTGDGITAVPVGRSCFQRRYLNLLNELPNVRIFPSIEPMGSGYVTFDGGWGVIMPMHP